MPNGPQTFDYEPVVNTRRRPPRAPALEESAGEAAPRAEADARSEAAMPLLLRAERWGARRAHAFSFAGLLVFTLVLYFRPQDYLPWLATAHIALLPAIFMLLAFVPSQLSAEGSLTARPREVSLVLLLVASAMLSVPLAVSPPLALEAFWDACLKNALTFIMFVNIVRTERRLRVMLYVAQAVTALLCVLAINDYRLGNLAAEGYRVVGQSTSGLFENTNDLGIHLVTMLPIAVALALGGRGFLRRMLFGGCAALALATVVLTFSRGAFLGLLASGALLAWKLGQRNRLLVFGSLALTAVVFMALAPGEYWLRLASIFEPSLDRFGSAQARAGLLEHSLVAAIANPVFGLGINNFPLTSMRGQVTHNAYMQVASELGFAGAVVYTMFIVAPLKRLRLIERATFAGRRASKFYYLSVGLQASLVGYMVSSFFVSVAFYLYIYYLVGYAVCLRRLYVVAAAEGREEAAADARPALGAGY